MKFIDLFAGLGGFHLALSELGHECVFASEIDNGLRETYKRNFGIYPEGDIQLVDEKDIPEHDILCAGFPCQPFSKAGGQKGLKDRKRGGLFHDIIRIVKYHKPKYIILENVPHIRHHNHGKTWLKMERLLMKEGYSVYLTDLSPHQFGIPQIRFRTYIVASLNGLDGFSLPVNFNKTKKTSVRAVLETNPKKPWLVPQRVIECLNVWQEFLDSTPKDTKIPLPLWTMEFGANYPYKRTTPHLLSSKKLRMYKGSFGKRIPNVRKKHAMLYLPSHARRTDRHFPEWKIEIIKKNRDFYKQNKDWLDLWIQKIQNFPPSYQKLEWNCSVEQRKIYSYIIQMRPSGVRVKRLDTAPTLVAMNMTQIPIIPWESRYMTLTECKRLQSMNSLKYLPERRTKAYKALGNAVNVEVVKTVAKSLLQNN